MTIEIPEPSLVLLVGPSGAGKSTFARRLFRPTAVVSSDACRALVSDDENDQSASKDAFEILHLIAAKRLARGRLTVIDATNVQPEARRSLLALAAAHEAPAVAIVFDLPLEESLRQNQSRADRVVDPAVIQVQAQNLHASLATLGAEGFARVYTLTTTRDVQAARLEMR